MPDPIKLELNSSGILIDPGTTEVGWLGKVEWDIADRGIASFRIVGKYAGAKDPFYGKLDTNFKKQHSGTALLFISRDWDYKIEWKATGRDEVFVLDPKISVRPGPSPIAISIGVTILVLILVTRFFTRRFQRIK